MHVMSGIADVIKLIETVVITGIIEIVEHFKAIEIIEMIETADCMSIKPIIRKIRHFKCYWELLVINSNQAMPRISHSSMHSGAINDY